MSDQMQMLNNIYRRLAALEAHPALANHPTLKNTRDLNSRPPFEFTLHCHKCLQAIHGDYIEPSPGKWYHPDCWVMNESSSATTTARGFQMAIDRDRELEQARADLDKAMADNIKCNSLIGQMQKEITSRDHTIERCGKRTAELEENNEKQIQAKLDACKRAEVAERQASDLLRALIKALGITT